MTYRLLSAKEALVVRVLLERADDQRWHGLGLELLRVKDMDDGGMGSLSFQPATPDPRFGAMLSEGWFKDADGTPVIVSINLDRDDNIFELDSWKVDYSPLLRLPASAGDILNCPVRMR
ncbi:DUF6984 family protein [Arthrobacter sp. 35W]|uniref:DUF6984 family protein n=1 Tax=Arthrobacter sp. 35W TaxID=1132441 RepID=UPI00047E8F1E|nr:hypothetical protein [Arthrobacter sp. 35W]